MSTDEHGWPPSSGTLASLAPTMQLTLEQAPPWKSEVRRAAVMALGLLEQVRYDGV
jgi:hypothetical protein